MAVHPIEPERRTLHGKFSRELAPILTIESGDTVRYRTLDAGWNLTPTQKFEPRDAVLDAGHALCGPIAVRGAEPGMALEVRIGEIHTGDWGWTVAGGWPSDFNRHLGMLETTNELRWTLDPEANIGRDQRGHAVRLRPFLGVMGMPPDEAGLHSTAPPRFCGGNMDCKELVADSTLFLPISVPGALFSAGDGHAVQADGEASGTAIECPMNRVDLTFHLRPDLRLTTPRAHTPAAWLTLGFHEDLDQAALIALDAMLDLMGERHALSRPDALALASLVVDLRITQIVNGVKGVHAVLPHDALPAA